jgi:hypothetical protein
MSAIQVATYPEEVRAQAAVDLTVFHGFQVRALREVFERICDPVDWKAPIHCACTGEALHAVVTAIQYFTATTPAIGLDVETMTYYIASEGYRAGPAGP